MVVDASVWIASLLAHDDHHGPSRAWLVAFLGSGGTPVIPTLALAEVAGGISRRVGRAAVGQRAIAGILATPGLRLMPFIRALGEEAARLASTHFLKGADAVYVATALLFGTSLVTWDQEVVGRASPVVQVTHP